MATNNTTKTPDANPWKGLNFYLEGEKLYGRDNEIQSLAQYVINNTQTVLYGRSGIGKSSIINAGIFPVARREGLYPISIRLKHDVEASYVTQVQSTFLSSTSRRRRYGSTSTVTSSIFQRLASPCGPLLSLTSLRRFLRCSTTRVGRRRSSRSWPTF